MATNAQPLVRGFQGEDRRLPDDLLPDHISPDALNVDYSRSTIQKRKGYTKLHQNAVVSGGVRIQNNPVNNRCIIIPDSTPLDLGAPSTLEIFIRFNEDLFATTTSPYILTKIDVANTEGWRLRYSSTNERWQLAMFEGDNDQVNINLDQIVEVGEIYHLAITRSGTTLTFRSTPLSTNVTVSNTGTVTGTSDSDDDVWIGAIGDPSEVDDTPTAQVVDITVDELRVWDDARTTAEMDDTRYRELNEEEALDANLVGYWKMNEGVGSIVNDQSINQNHGTLFVDTPPLPNIVSGMVLDIIPGASDGFAVRLNGRDEGASIAYRAGLAPVLETGPDWTIEAWLRLDSDVGISDSRFIALGDFGVDNGCPFTIFVDSSLNLKISYSTTPAPGTDINNDVLDTGYDVVVGQAFHFAVVKKGTDAFGIRTYVNGVFQIGVADADLDENGPTTSTLVGMTVGYMVTNTVNGNFCPCTVDEVRLWSIPLSAFTIRTFMDYSGAFPADMEAVLLSRLKFDADSIFVDSADTDEVITYIPGPVGFGKPVWTRGFVYPLKPEALQLTAPLTKFLGGADASTGQTLARHEVLAATRTDFWLLRSTIMQHLDELIEPNSADNRYTQTMYRNLLIAVNGLGRNYRYDSKRVPESLTLPAWTDDVTAVAAGAGAQPDEGYGIYIYRFAWHSHVSDIAGLSGGQVSVDVQASNDRVDLSDIVATIPDSPGVTHVHIYRTTAGGSVFRLITDLELGTTTYVDNLDETFGGLELLNLRRGHPAPHKICAVYSNRLFLANESDNPSSVRYSDAATEDFVATNSFTVDENDGDEITGMKAAFGGLVIFKQNSIHFLTGFGENTFRLVKLVDGIGCVSHNTIAGSPGGLYFLGEDGVYIFNGQSAVYLSHSQQPEFQKLDRPKARNAVGVYDISTHQYIVSFDQAQDNPTLSFFDVKPDLFTHYWKLKDLTDATGRATVLNEVGGAGTGIFHPDAERGITWNGGKLEVTDDSLVAQGATADVTLGCWVYFVTNDGIHQSSGPFDILDSAHSTVVMDITVSTAGPEETIGPTANITGASLTQAALERKRWYHCVMTKNGNVLRFYLDGELFSQDLADDSTWDATMADLVIGGDITWGWDGKLQNLFIINNAGLTGSKVKELYDAEATGKLVGTRPTFAYDEETQSWALWGKDFDTLVLAEHTSSQNDVVAGKNGFVHKILHSDRDGAGFIEGGSVGVSGALASESGPFITDTDNDFPVGGDGLAGVEFVAVPTNTTLSTQRRLILYNTATELQLDSPLHPAVTGTYFIGPIDLHWESRWMDMGDPSVIKTWRTFQAWCVENSATPTFKHKTEENETFQTSTFSTADEFKKFVMNNSGLKLKVRFEHITTDETFQLQSFQALFEPAEEVD